MKLKLVDNLKGKERVLVTSALPYVNYEPHLGHLAGAVLSADVYFKYLQLKQVPSIYICGTDENGSTTEVTAKKMNISPKELCDKYHKIHKESYEKFGITFTYFGRTSSEKHAQLTQHIYKKLKENGYIIEKESIQAYCETCKIELADRFIQGTCPHCGYELATGGQCEKCGNIVEPTELINPKCTICNNPPKFANSKHLYLDLPALKEDLKKFINSKSEWSENAKKFSLNMVEELKPRAITRRLTWGVKVPDSDLVFYVWFDAPIGYISFTYEALPEADLWWKGNTRLVQFMGKDNIPFHSIMFPAQLLGTKENWILVDVLASTEYLNYEGGKFSKSQKRGVFCTDAINSGIPVDYWRFYLMYNRPEKSDTDFNWDDFYERINKDLLGNFVNFAYRVISLSEKYLNSEVPEHQLDPVLDEVFEKVNLIDQYLDQIRIKDYVRTMLEISAIGNKYLQENEPWSLIKTNPEKAAYVLCNALEILKILAIVSKPVIPNLAEKISRCLHLEEKNIKYWQDLEKPLSGKIHSERISEKLEYETIAKLRLRFSGIDFKILNLRVGKIISVEKVPNSLKLYKFIVDAGTEKRQILAGLQKYYKEEELLNRNIVFVANLKPAKLAGLESQGMVLAAENDKGDVKLLEAPESLPGMQVYIDEKYEQNNIITIEEFLNIKLSLKKGIVYFEDKPLKTDKETIKCDISNEEKAQIR
ncbi:MAG: methionine--tRNA ligase [Candidatus Woesearchaeota archaeon]